MNSVEEVLYGGAAGGGKSDALLMAVLQYVDVPGYAALVLRRTYKQLTLPGSILDRAHLWLRRLRYVEDDDGVLRLAPGQVPPDAKAQISKSAHPGEGKSLVDWGLTHWNAGEWRYEFTSGATVTFGHLQTEEDKHKYDGPEFQTIVFDELVHFDRSQYTHLNSRLRKPQAPTDPELRQAAEQKALAGGSLELWQVPLRMRAGSNPGGRGHHWVKHRFIGDPKRAIPPSEATARFIPARLEDNPSVDMSYEAVLQKLDQVSYRQLRLGSWDDVAAGEYFQRVWYGEVDEWEIRGTTWAAGPLRYWDLAATEQRKTKTGRDANDPDYAVGAKMAFDGYNWYILDIVRLRNEPSDVEKAIVTTAGRDGVDCAIWIEQEPGASGKMYVNSLARRLAKHVVQGHRPTGSKLTRAKVVSSKVKQQMMRVVRAAWNEAYYLEAEDFTGVEGEDDHDDQVDAVSGAFDRLGVGGEASSDDTTMPDDDDHDDWDDDDDDDW